MMAAMNLLSTDDALDNAINNPSNVDPLLFPAATLLVYFSALNFLSSLPNPTYPTYDIMILYLWHLDGTSCYFFFGPNCSSYGLFPVCMTDAYID